jgi:hypothetical protein
MRIAEFVEVEPGPEGPSGDDGFELPPDCSAGGLDIEIHDIGTSLRGIDSAPTVTALVSVKDSAGNYILGLREADFFDAVDEDGNAYNLQVTEVEGVGSVPKVDIIFVLDSSGSMLGERADVINNAGSLADSFVAEGIDARFGFIHFADDIRGVFAPTSDVDAFKTALAAVSVTGGGDTPENQIDALDYARAEPWEVGSNPVGSAQTDGSFSYRSGAKRIFILLTDANFHTPDGTTPGPGNVLYYYDDVYNTLEEEIAKLNNSNVTVFTVTSSTYAYAEYSQLAAETGGLWFDITGDFGAILETIGTAVLNNYVITYMTQDLSLETLRNVRIAVHARNFGVPDCGEDTDTYLFPGSVPFPTAAMVLEPRSMIAEELPLN